ncbi:DUF1549 domain-containing protein [Lignipirellula cremea]|nr:DUF1549 domain-containing protein [Lignipirellula cremea]
MVAVLSVIACLIGVLLAGPRLLTFPPKTGHDLADQDTLDREPAPLPSGSHTANSLPPVSPQEGSGNREGSGSHQPANSTIAANPQSEPHGRQQLPGTSGSGAAEPPFRQLALREFSAPQTQPFTTQAPLLSQPHVRPTPAPRDDMLETVNAALHGVWKVAKVEPAVAVDSAAWLTRIYASLAGKTPSPQEIARFVAQDDRPAREAVVDQLLATDAFTDHWGKVFAHALLAGTGDADARDQLQAFLAKSLKEDKPYDQIATELLTAVGSPSPAAADFNPAASFLVAAFDSKGAAAASRTASVFLGKQLQCAQCHDHPANEWRQADFWEMAAFFRQLKLEHQGDTDSLVNVDFRGEDNDPHEAAAFYERPSGELAVAYPRFAQIETPRTGRVDEFNRREALATLVTQSEDFGRAAVNRVWREFFGFGFTHPIDDMGPHNPPAHAELLEQIAEQFRAHHYDLKELIRWVALSEPMTLSSKSTADNLADVPEWGETPLFSRYYKETPAAGATDRRSPRALLAAAVDPLHGLNPDAGTAGVLPRRPGGQVQNANVGVQLTPASLAGVARPHRYLLDSLAKSDLSEQLLIDHLFWAALSRSATGAEKKAALAILSQAKEPGGDRPEVLQRIWWALLASEDR